MSLSFPRISRIAMLVMGLLALTSVYAHPIREASSKTGEKSTHVLESRDPRLIPDTEHYLADVLDSIGVGDPQPDHPQPDHPQPDPSSQASDTPTHTIKVEQDHPVNTEGTPSSTGSESKFTTNIYNGDDQPIKNIQIGSGWDGKKELQASDLPKIFTIVGKEMEKQFHNIIDSSDELGLGL